MNLKPGFRKTVFAAERIRRYQATAGAPAGCKGRRQKVEGGVGKAEG